MANRNNKTAGEAAAAQQAAPAPAAGQEGQPNPDADTQAGSDAGDEGGEAGDGSDAPDYPQRYQEAAAQVQQLTTELAVVTQERDEARADLQTQAQAWRDALDQRDSISQSFYEYRLAHGEQPAANLPTQPAESTTTPAVTEPPTEQQTPTDPHAEARAAMKRNGLTNGWVMPDGRYVFSEKHAREWAGSDEAFAALTLLTTE